MLQVREGKAVCATFDKGRGIVMPDAQFCGSPPDPRSEEDGNTPQTSQHVSACLVPTSALRFEVVGHEDEAIHVNVEDSDLADSFVFTVSSCTCGARYKLV